MCFSGRGGKIPSAGGRWRTVGRDEAKRRFRDREADVLLCTDAAAEGLNFQFCGAVINYDMPWNSMRVEQRIGRIDHVGQTHATIRVVNLQYEGTVETDVIPRSPKPHRLVRNGGWPPAADPCRPSAGDHQGRSAGSRASKREQRRRRGCNRTPRQ